MCVGLWDVCCVAAVVEDSEFIWPWSIEVCYLFCKGCDGCCVICL